jgi:hypothetical protein
LTNGFGIAGSGSKLTPVFRAFEGGPDGYLRFTFAVPFFEVATGDGEGTMDIATFNALIAQVRETAASLAQAEQKVAAFKTELAEQEAERSVGAAPARSIRSIPKRSSGWVAAMDKLPKAS